MLATSRQLAQALDGEVLDQDRSTLTRQTARHIRERIITFETQLKMRRPS
jgi:FtsZ-interacting cell division protein ZipA